MGKIIVVGLGPAGPELITKQTSDILECAKEIRLRTKRHPAASVLQGVQSFDDIYNVSESIELVYQQIVEELIALSNQNDEVVYAVPGSPLVAESTVDLLRSRNDVQVEIIPALSFLDIAWAKLAVDPLLTCPRIVNGHNFVGEAAGERGPLLVAQCDAQWVLSEIKLAFEEETPEVVTVIQRLGLEDESIITVPWEDLDRVVEADHLTSLWIPEVPATVGSELIRLDQVAQHLRRECPWDREQTHSSLARHLIEEAYELLDAIDEVAEANKSEDITRIAKAEEEFIEELGDVLFQVFVHTAIAQEEGRFNTSDVAKGIADKLIERHPHVYGSDTAHTVEDVMNSWEKNKKAKKGRASLMDGIPKNLPALLLATKVLEKAGSVNISLNHEDMNGTGVGGALMILVDEARKQGVDPEGALREVAGRFRNRFEDFEARVVADGVDPANLSAENATLYWQRE